MGYTGAHAPSTSNNFSFNSRWSKSDSQLSRYCVICEISWCRCQQLTALSIGTASVTKLLVIEQLLHPALKLTVSAPWHNFQLCPSSQQILATPLSVQCCRHLLYIGVLSTKFTLAYLTLKLTVKSQNCIIFVIFYQFISSTFTPLFLILFLLHSIFIMWGKTKLPVERHITDSPFWGRKSDSCNGSALLLPHHNLF